MKAQGALEPFVRQKTFLLTTYRRNGAPVGTPVNIAVEGARAFVRTWDKAWNLARYWASFTVHASSNRKACA